MKNLSEILGVDFRNGDLFGVEVECEGRNIQRVDARWWVETDDGSLRGRYPYERCEFVMKRPSSFNVTMAALKYLAAHQADAGLDFSHRTSVHVHLNVSDLTWEEYCTLLYLYLLLEEPMMQKCGEKRIGNRFCLRLQDAEALMDTITYILRRGPRSLREVDPNEVRYAAINIAATSKYGSLEFRGMEGTLDVARLKEWINAIWDLKRFARGRSVHDIKNYNPMQLLHDVLGKGFEYSGVEMDMMLSHSLTCDIPYLYKGDFVQEDAPKKAYAPKRPAVIFDQLVNGVPIAEWVPVHG